MKKINSAKCAKKISTNLFFLLQIIKVIKLEKKPIIYYILYLYKIYPGKLFSKNFNIKR